MLEVTKPFNKYNHFFKVANNVPTTDINLSYFNSNFLSPTENLIVNNNYDLKIYENKEQMVFSDLDYKLKDIDTEEEVINTEYCFITDVFYGDEPLYYCYKLSHYIYAESPILQGEYNGKHIHLEDIYGNIDLPSTYHYLFYFKRPRHFNNLGIDNKKYILNQVYECYIYTNFLIKDGYRIRSKYSAFINGEIVQNYIEEINPNTVFTKANNVYSTIKNSNCYYIKKDYDNLYSSIISIGSGVKDDTRTPQEIRVRVDVTFEDGSSDCVYFPNETDTMKLYHYNSLLNSELDKCVNKRQQLSLLPISGYFEKQGIIKVEPIIDDIDRGKQMIKFYFSSDGNSPLFATTELEQEKIEGWTCKKYIKKEDKVLTCYSILKRDSEEISIDYPREYLPEQSWFIRIKNGKYVKTDGEISYHYFLPQYYNQKFTDIGFPYKEVKNEIPLVISEHCIKVKYFPIYKNIEIRNEDTKDVLTVTNIIYNDGLVFVEESLTSYDNLLVNYIYEEHYITYTGYKDNYLDCNPNKHHKINFTTPTFTLLDKTIYLYLKPAMIKTKYGIESNTDVLFHTFEELSPIEIEANNYILLGVVSIRPNSAFSSLLLKDTRSRGGGVTELISDEVRKMLEPESDWYFDIGYIDGIPFNDNSTIVIKLDKRILVEFGGHFEKEEVEKAVYKHVALGTYVIIEYVTTYPNLEVNVL